MQKLCWACTEPYDDSLAKCPYCGVPRENPRVPEPQPVKPPVVEKKVVPVVKKPVVKKPPGRK